MLGKGMCYRYGTYVTDKEYGKDKEHVTVMDHITDKVYVTHGYGICYK